MGRGISVFVASLLASLPPSRARAGEVVRIAVTTGRLEVEVAAASLAAEPLRDGATRTAVPGGAARLRLVDGEILLDGQPVAGAGVAFTATGPIRHAGRDLSGEVEVRRALGGLEVIDVLPLEEYVAAVTGAEMPPSFPPEALKAQAVAARTFAMARKIEARELGLDYDLGATVLDQVYPGAGGVDPRARTAAAATSGEVLVYEHRPIEAYFHSACGGATESGADALGRELPYLTSVHCGRCQDAPRYRWKLVLPAAEMGRLAGLSRPATAARVAGRTPTGRVSQVEVRAGDERAVIEGAEFRRRAGFDRLPSLAFAIQVGPRGFVLEGRGSGHGAGLCQWGAAGRARAGEGYREILRRYYPGAELVRMY
ncbi:MAG TPA: SpoIID/LytB domain-containing protein [Anaeromyxobacteraceae bacterium]|nr:SpoIID/LytB domain-containing protein [Anaeromyxobacteraceae bacterium]